MSVSSASRSPSRQRTNNSVTALDGSGCKLNALTADRKTYWPRRIAGIRLGVNSLKISWLTAKTRAHKDFWGQPVLTRAVGNRIDQNKIPAVGSQFELAFHITG